MQNTETPVPAPSGEMHAFIKNICSENPKEKVVDIRKEFRGKVCKTVFDGSKKAYYENYELNRYSNIYLWDATRVRIREPVANEYVHASYVQDPSRRLRLIASQGPLPHTVADFWQMVFEHDASVVVQLCDFVENGWPKTEPYFMDSTFGRTGSFISSVLSYLLLDSNKQCDVAEVVRSVRSQRMHSVETDLQYLFVYRLTLELCVHANPSLVNSQLKRFFAEYENLALAESQMSHDYITWDRRAMFFGE